VTALQFALSESKILFKVHRIPFKGVQQPNRPTFVQFMFSEQKPRPKVDQFLPQQIADCRLQIADCNDETSPTKLPKSVESRVTSFCNFVMTLEC
jgi:hypothetical protein